MNDWWLKFQRAEKHMVDIQEEARRYASRNPYSMTRIRLPDSQNEIGFRFHITEQPDPVIALMLGDFIHNLRSALDYIIVACIPRQRRKNASFPIMYKDIFAKGEDGQFVVKDACLRENVETTLDGLHPKARALVILMQPWQAINLGLPPDNVLGVLCRLENADKHRKIITLGCGGQDFAANAVVRGFTEPIESKSLLATGTEYLQDDAVILYKFPPWGIHYSNGSPIEPPDVEMHFSGTVKISVEVPHIGGNHPSDNVLIDYFMSKALLDVRFILIGLESFVVSN